MEEKKKNPFDFKKLKKENFVVILLIGVLLLVIALPVSDKKTENEGTKSGITDTNSSILNLTKTEGNESEQAGEIKSGDELQSYAASLERTLEDILSVMEGAGKVKVMITMESSAEAIVEKDVNKEISASTEVDSEGGSRNTSGNTQAGETVYKNDGSNNAVPYVKQVICPKIAGVVVCAQGGDNETVNKNITEAIQALFGIEIHKIKVIKMSSK